MPTKQPDKPKPRHPSPPFRKNKIEVAEARAPGIGKPANLPEALYRHIVETAQEGIWVTDSSGRITFANEIMARMLGYDSPSDIVGRPVFDFMDRQARTVARARLKRRRAGIAEHYEFKLLRKAGRDLWVLVAANPLQDEQGHFAGALMLFTDITQRRQAEHVLEQINRAYRTLSAGNQALLHAVDEDSLLHDVCRAIHQVGGYHMAWVGYKIDDGAKTVLPMAWSGTGGDELPGAKLTWAGTEQGRGPSGTAIRTAKPVVMQNLATDPRFVTYRERALELGHGSVAVFPISNEGEVLGILGVYAAEPDAFGDKEVQLLAEMAGDLAYGVNTLRARAERKRAETALRESEASFKLLFFANPHPMWVYDVDTLQFLEVNDVAVRRYGYSHEEFLRMKISEIRPEQDILRLHKSVQDDLENPHASGEWRHRLKNGQVIDVEIVSHILPFAGHRARLVVAHDITARKQAEQELKRANRLYRTLSAGNQALVRATQEQALLDEVSRLIVEVGGYIAAGVAYKEEDEARTVRPMAWSGIGGDKLPGAKRTWADPEDGQNPTAIAIRTGQPYILRDIEADPYLSTTPIRTRGQGRNRVSMAALPLIVEGHVLGALSVLAAETDAFGERELELLSEMAGDLAYGIRALRTHALHEQAEQALARQTQRLSTLYAVGQVVNSTLDVGEILDFVVDEAMRVTHAERGLALVVDPATRVFERQSLRGFTSAEMARTEEPRLRLDQGLNGQAYQTRRMVRVDDVHAQTEYYPLSESTRSELVVPILREQEVLGNIDLQSPEVGAFREVDSDYLRALAEQAALAIFNARLYHELETYSGVLEQAVAERTAEVQATKDRVETILSSVGDALLVLRMDGRIEQVNSAFERQTGYTAVEAELKDHHDLLKLEFGSKGDYQAALETLTPGQVWQGETKVHRKDGSVYDASLTIAPVRDAQGAIRLLVAIIRDITPLKEVERAKDQFVSNVSHELRTPITSLRLNHDLIRRNPAGQDRYVDRMGREISRLNDLIEDLLRLSRLDQGSIQLDLKPLDLNTLAAQYVDDRAPLAESRGLSLIFEGAPDLPLVMADAGLLGQALSVLLTNALNYTPAGGRVTIGTHRREVDGQNWAGFSVSDTGPGIPPTELSQLFTRFFRGSVGRKSGAAGTGLGLAIAKEIVERHAGLIEVASQEAPGAGADFSVWLPVIDNHPPVGEKHDRPT